MGILGYPNMDDNNQDGVFGDYSDVYSNFSDEQSASEVSENTENADFVEESFDQQAEAAANLNAETQVDTNTTESSVEGKGVQEEASLEQRRAAQAANNSKSNTFVLVLLLLALVAAGLYYYKNNMMSDTAMTDVQAMGDYFYNAAGGNTDVSQSNAVSEDAKAGVKVEVAQPQENIATIDVNIEPVAKNAEPQNVAVTSKNTSSDEKNTLSKVLDKKKALEKKVAEDAKKMSTLKFADVVIPVSSGGRTDPFVPSREVRPVASLPKFDIIAPPIEIPEQVDPMINKMSSFKISGIMFDDLRPSAILTIDGAEQLVHKGDLIAGYEIKDITRTKVIVKYESNIYEVSAGEKINLNGVNVNPVTTLNKQFGGAYKETPENAIKFY